MLTIKEDFEITNSEDDKLGLGKDINTFIKKYIEQDYKGSVLLSGKWGIGKTSYLKQIEEKVKKDKKKDKKFVWLDYWDKNNQTKFYTYLYSKLKPKMYSWCKLWPLLLVIFLSIVQFALVLVQFVLSMFKDMQHLPSNNMIIISLITWAILFVVSGTLTFVKDNYSEEKKYKKKIVRYLKKHNVILIFDDFDRIDNESRNALFHHLSEVNLFKKSLIIVVGEYKKLIEGNDNIFTQKVLNNVEYMPLKTNSSNVWKYFVEVEIEKLVDTSNKTRSDDFLFSDIREQFVADNRTFREAKQLLNSFEFEYVEIREKEINSSEALAINYIYQFYNGAYEVINNNLDVIYGDDMRLKGSYDRNKIRSNIEEVMKKNYAEISNGIINLIYSVFHNNNKSFYYLSISDRINYVHYQIGNDETSSVSKGKINEYLQSDLSESSLILDQLTEKDFERFHNLMLNKINSEESDEKQSLSLLKKLIYYKFHGKHGNDKFVFSINYIDKLIYNVTNDLSVNLNYYANNQYRDTVLENKDLDISQKLELISMFVPATSNKEIQEQVKLVEEIIRHITYKDILNMNKPIYVYHFFTTYYNELKDDKYIEAELFKVLELEDIEFYEFVYEKLVNKVTTSRSNGSIEYTRTLNIKEICFNDAYEEAFLNKIEQLDNDKKDNIKDIIVTQSPI
ncbi:P-loop NTPase fold protein [Staphylococcus saprophyticus]|uniref:P-loop NTPase fold protein n=1 Tax=Staphylococcus saprophyticus TaxID=29385 RepID=UPI0011A35742|nr:P-loop NTPase fold protein [Staphylococcus saprophyticus]